MSTLLQLRTSVRGQLGEDSPAWFTDVFLNGTINDSMFELYNEMVEASVEFFTTTQTISLVASQEKYSLTTPAYKITLVERVDSTQPVPIDPIDITQRSRYLYSTVNPSSLITGEMRYYMEGTQIGFVPITADAVAAAILVHYTPLPTAMAADGDSPPAQWPANHHEVIYWGALMRAGVRDKDLLDRYAQNFGRLRENFKACVNQRQTQKPRNVVDTDMD